MKSLKNNLPVVLLILFEFAVGVLLFTDPESFTSTVIIVFGVLLIATGLFYIFRFLAARGSENGAGAFTLILAVISLAAGCVCVFAKDWLMGLFAVVAVIYGVILAVTGVYKVKTFFDAHRENIPTSFLTLLSAVLSVALGIVIIINPFDTVKVLWMFAGIALIAEALFDLAAVALIARGKKKEEPEKPELPEGGAKEE